MSFICSRGVFLFAHQNKLTPTHLHVMCVKTTARECVRSVKGTSETTGK